MDITYAVIGICVRASARVCVRACVCVCVCNCSFGYVTTLFGRAYYVCERILIFYIYETDMVSYFCFPEMRYSCEVAFAL